MRYELLYLKTVIANVTRKLYKTRGLLQKHLPYATRYVSLNIIILCRRF